MPELRLPCISLLNKKVKNPWHKTDASFCELLLSVGERVSSPKSEIFSLFYLTSPTHAVTPGTSSTLSLSISFIYFQGHGSSQDWIQQDEFAFHTLYQLKQYLETFWAQGSLISPLLLGLLFSCRLCFVNLKALLTCGFTIIITIYAYGNFFQQYRLQYFGAFVDRWSSWVTMIEKWLILWLWVPPKNS